MPTHMMTQTRNHQFAEIKTRTGPYSISMKWLTWGLEDNGANDVRLVLAMINPRNLAVCTPMSDVPAE